MIQIGSKTISNIQFGSKTSTELYLGSTKIWPEGGSTETWPEGTFLYTKNNEYITADQYSNGYTKDDIVGVYHYDTLMYDDGSGIIESPQPILVAIDVPDMLSSAGISDVKVCRSSATDIIGIGTAEITDTGYHGAYSDWNGYENTQVLNNLLATDNNIVEDAAFVAATCFAVDGRQGYLPAAAELHRAVLHRDEIQELISLVGGTVTIAGSTFVSSTKITSDGSGTNKFYCKQGVANNFLENTDTTEVLVFFKPGEYTCDYYGVKFEGDSTDGTRVGNLDLAKSLPLQSKMRGCTLTSDGTVRYLNPKNWEYYEDGGSRDYSLNTMVELPEYWCYGANLTFGTGGDHIILVTENPTYGWYHFPKRYVGAYEGSLETVSGKLCLRSVMTSSGRSPRTGVTVTNFNLYAKNNGDSWNMYTYDIHKQIVWMFVTEYATRNTQESFVNQVDVDGYKIGGLGDGYTTTGELVTNYYVGLTDSIGNYTGESMVASGNGGYMSRYRGIENTFGGVEKVVVDLAEMYPNVCINDDYTTFGEIPQTQLVKCIKGGAHGTSFANSTGNCLELIEDTRSTLEGSTATYWADYQQFQSTSTAYFLTFGGDTTSDIEAGLFCLNANVRHLTGISDDAGTRLTYYPSTGIDAAE